MEKDTICSGNRNILLTCTHLRFHISTLGLINHTFGTQFVHMHAKHEKWKASQRDSNCFPRRHWNTTHTQCVHWWFRLDFHIARCVAINDIQSIYRYVFYFIHDSILKLKCETWKVLWAGKNVQIHTRARQTMRVEIAANTSGSMNKQIHASTRTSEMKSTAIYSLGLHEMRVDLLGLSKHSDELHFKTNNIMQMLRCSLFHLMKFQINTKNIQIIYTERKRERGDKTNAFEYTSVIVELWNRMRFAWDPGDASTRIYLVFFLSFHSHEEKISIQINRICIIVMHFIDHDCSEKSDRWVQRVRAINSKLIQRYVRIEYDDVG